MSDKTIAAAKAFRDAAFAYLNEISNGSCCSDRSCLRCRIADAAFEVEIRHGIDHPDQQEGKPVK